MSAILSGGPRQPSRDRQPRHRLDLGLLSLVILPDMSRHAGSPADELRRLIAAEGSIDFATYMRIALYSDGGFFSKAGEVSPVGRHFLTSPHIHPSFAVLLARLIRRMWVEQGRPRGFTVVELGAGDGTLARDLSANLSDTPHTYIPVEVASGAQHGLREKGFTPLASVGGLPPIRSGCVIANELLDNIPFRRVRRGLDGRLVEIRIGAAAGPRGTSGAGDHAGFVEVESAIPPADPLLEETATLEIAPGSEATVPLEACRLISELAGKLHRGHGVIIDYGSAGDEERGSVHGYRDQRLVEDVLRDPGTTDITAGVDFGYVARQLAASGSAVGSVTTQRDALLALGWREVDGALKRRQDQQREEGNHLAEARTYAERGRASLLVDRTGLGGLKWLPFSTLDLRPLPEPRTIDGSAARPT
jgi:SAM-dependent MidA family methyltransferase